MIDLSQYDNEGKKEVFYNEDEEIISKEESLSKHSKEGILDFINIKFSLYIDSKIVFKFILALGPYGRSPKYNSCSVTPKLHKSHFSL